MGPRHVQREGVSRTQQRDLGVSLVTLFLCLLWPPTNLSPEIDQFTLFRIDYKKSTKFG